MEEIASKDFPPSFTGTCPAPDPGDERAEYLNVCDYHGYSETVIEDIAGNDLGLSGYGISVDVVAAGNDFPSMDTNDAVRVTVTVSHPLSDSLVMRSYRARY
jgi:hypothetical protein